MDKDILLVCWFILFPLIHNVGSYLQCVIRRIEGRDPDTDIVRVLKQFIYIIILFTIAIIIHL